MQINLLWTGLAYHSLENCLVDSTPGGSEINSTIVGKYGNKIYRVAYQIKTGKNWETLFFEIKSRHSDRDEYFNFTSDGNGNWMMNGRKADEFRGCLDIDISVTPFTNTLAINRLGLSIGEEQEIRVIYFDPLENRIQPLRQKYRRLSRNAYQFENVPNDFEAQITVDESGFVVDYPSLFVLTAALKSNYP